MSGSGASCSIGDFCGSFSFFSGSFEGFARRTQGRHPAFRVTGRLAAFHKYSWTKHESLNNRLTRGGAPAIAAFALRDQSVLANGSFRKGLAVMVLGQPAIEVWRSV